MFCNLHCVERPCLHHIVTPLGLSPVPGRIIMVGVKVARARSILLAVVLCATAATAAAQGGPGEPATPGALPPIVDIPQIAGGESAPPPTGRYVFPVFGSAASYTDDWGAPRAGTGSHFGNDIFAPTGTPVVAVADGEIYKVGVNRLGGNRLWLRDGHGNTYYYAHLSGYASQTRDGARVRAGEIIGFVGNTGQAITTPPHLHFEIHPGDGDAVNPYPYLQAWKRGTTIPQAFQASTTSRGQAPAVGAVVVGHEPDAAPIEPGSGVAVAVS